MSAYLFRMNMAGLLNMKLLKNQS